MGASSLYSFPQPPGDAPEAGGRDFQGRPPSPPRPSQASPDLVGRHFHAEGINQRWFGDGTEIATDEGKRQMASVLDIGSRRVVGFTIGEHHDTELAYGALAMAVAIRGGEEAIAGVILHTD